MKTLPGAPVALRLGRRVGRWLAMMMDPGKWRAVAVIIAVVLGVTLVITLVLPLIY